MSAENKLNDTRLRALYGKKTTKQKTLADGRGLSVRISPAGNISFMFFYRTGNRASSPVWLTLGKYPDMSLKLAREKRNACRRLLAEQKDPRYVVKDAEEQQAPVTVEDALNYWIRHYATENRKYWRVTQYRLRHYIIRRVGNIPLEHCTARVWLKCFDDIKKTAPFLGRFLGSFACFLMDARGVNYCY